MAREITSEQEIWVLTGEGADLTGYNSQYVKKLAQKNWRLPENERVIKVRKRRSHFFELWLPDLLHYIDEVGYGPHQNKE